MLGQIWRIDVHFTDALRASHRDLVSKEDGGRPGMAPWSAMSMSRGRGRCFKSDAMRE